MNSSSDVEKLKELLAEGWPELSQDIVSRILVFYDLVFRENEVQNLTRLISPKDFYEGHVLDIRALFQSNLVDFPALDLGSGAGVPGLLAALIRKDRWILAESEKNKAKFLENSVKTLGLEHVQVHSGRAEAFLREYPVRSIVVRAVGSLDKLYEMVRRCSTWNNLVLMKGPAWKEEWEKFQMSRFGHDLKVAGQFEYAVGEVRKQRIIIRVKRVSERAKKDPV